MITQFRSLFTIAPSHTYYGGTCDDFEFLMPGDTKRSLKNGKLLMKAQQGRLTALCETDVSGTPLARLDGAILRLGLRLVNPFFANYTEAPASQGTPLYTNLANPLAISVTKVPAVVGTRFAHELVETRRPVTVRLDDAKGETIITDLINTSDGRSSVSYELSERGRGLYSVAESYEGSTTTAAYYVDEEMVGAGIFAIVEITVDSLFYASAADFQIVFRAREELLRYYVVARNYSDGEMAQLSVSDEGFSEEGRPKVLFTTKDASALADDATASILRATSGGRVVLFESQTKVARRERGRKKIRLAKNGDVLIANMPQPGQEKTDSTMIVNISKP